MSAGIISFGKDSWKYATALIAVLGWAFTKEKPEFPVITKLAYLGFLLKVYWPELVILAILILIATWATRSLDGSEKGIKTILDKISRKARGHTRNVPAWDLALGAAVFAAVTWMLLPSMIKQFSLMVDVESQFYSGRLANWFGTEQHAVAARQLRRGDYALAIQTLNAQEKELAGIQEGDTAKEVREWLTKRVEPIAQLAPMLRARIDVAGVSRSDILIQGAMAAMRPGWPVDEPTPYQIHGSDQLRLYLEALKRLHLTCNEDPGKSFTARDIGRAVSALGFARWPQLFFGEARTVQERSAALCLALASKTPLEVEQAHTAAFSVSSKPERLDWRAKLGNSGATTSASDVWAAAARTLDVPFRKVMGAAPFARWYRPPFQQDLAEELSLVKEEVEVRIPAAEMSAIKHVEPVDDEASLANYGDASFTPITYVETLGGSAAQLLLTTYFTRNGTRALILCQEDAEGARTLSVTVVTASDGFLTIQPVDACGENTIFSVTKKVDPWRSVGVLLSLLETIDARRIRLAGVSGGQVREVLCESASSNLSRSDRENSRKLIRMCPVHALAHGKGILDSEPEIRVPAIIPTEEASDEQILDAPLDDAI